MGKFDSYFQNLHFNVRKHVVWAIWPGFGRRNTKAINWTAKEMKAGETMGKETAVKESASEEIRADLNRCWR